MFRNWYIYVFALFGKISFLLIVLLPFLLLWWVITEKTKYSQWKSFSYHVPLSDNIRQRKRVLTSYLGVTRRHSQIDTRKKLLVTELFVCGTVHQLLSKILQTFIGLKLYLKVITCVFLPRDARSAKRGIAIVSRPSVRLWRWCTVTI